MSKPMTNYNERLDEILKTYKQMVIDDEYNIKNTYTESEAKQSITSLIKELVAGAKPEIKVFGDGINDATYFQQKIVDQFEQNLLKALEEI